MQNELSIKSGSHFLFRNKVEGQIEVAEGKFLLTFEKQFELKAGHVVALTSGADIAPRIYSLCCGENEQYMQILYDLKPEGQLTPLLSTLKTGSYIYVSKPYGSFMPEKEMPMWWIATGTGIAPFRSMLQTGYKPQILLHGARVKDNFYFEREFKTALKAAYIQCYSGNEGVGDFFGRVSKYLEQKEQLPHDNKYYLCGRALMVVEVRDLLISKGIPYENIISEIFF